MLRILCTILFSLFSFSLASANVPVDPMVSVCTQYPEINDPTSFPKTFNNTNNLARPINDGFYEAQGEKITIYGRVMDSNCTPLSDAKIYIWQANQNGYVQYPIKTPNDRDHHQKWIDPNFSGTGITNSDNMGRFNFITIKPGSPNAVTPHIHLMVEHSSLKTLRSKIYFPSKAGTTIIDTGPNDEIFMIKDLNTIAQVSTVRDQKSGVYFIDITMSQAIKTKGY
jgi:protocatechuate 3,4-dioxygenase, beta subunit